MSTRKLRPAVARIWEGRKRGGVAEFMTISYWNSREEIRAYAGNDIEKTHHLPKDRDYLLELPRYVKHFDVLLSD